MSDLYSSAIFQLSTDTSHIGSLPPPRGRALMRSRSCGSSIQMDIRFEGDYVTDCVYLLEACIITQAAAALLTQPVIGAKASELPEICDKFQRLLEQGIEENYGRWEKLTLLSSLKSYKLRHESALLPFRAACAALQNWQEQGLDNK